jgi:hypothetical protein
MPSGRSCGTLTDSAVTARGRYKRAATALGSRLTMQPGEIYREAWALYKRFWKHFIPIALAIFLIVAVASLLLVLGLGWVGAIFAGLLSLVGTFWLQGAIAEAVADVRDGRADLSIGETINRVSPHVARLGAAGLLAVLGVAAGLILLIVPGLVLLTWWILIAPVIVLERRGIFESFGRSRELVRGNGWNVFGTIVLGILISIGASIVVSILLVWLPDWLQSFLGSLVSNGVIAPFVAAAWTLMYFRLRGEPAAEVAPEPSPATPM